MPTRNVVLTDHQASLVEQLVTSGRYQNASEVLREGLRLVEQREAEDAYRLEALRAAVKKGAADIEAGRFKTFDSKASLREHLKSITAERLQEHESNLACSADRSGQSARLAQASSVNLYYTHRLAQDFQQDHGATLGIGQHHHALTCCLPFVRSRYTLLTNGV